MKGGGGCEGGGKGKTQKSTGAYLEFVNRYVTWPRFCQEGYDAQGKEMP